MVDPNFFIKSNNCSDNKGVTESLIKINDSLTEFDIELQCDIIGSFVKFSNPISVICIFALVIIVWTALISSNAIRFVRSSSEICFILFQSK